MAEARSARGRLDLRSAREARSIVDLAEAHGRKPRRQGPEWLCLCPAHDDTRPSCTIYDDGRKWKCFACGAFGDNLDFERHCSGCSLPEAYARITGDDPVRLDPAELARREAERKRRIEAERYASRQKALRLWGHRRPLADTLARRYLVARGFDPLPAGADRALGFLEHATVPGAGARCPALIAGATRYPATTPCAVQCTALAEPGRKADVRPSRWTTGLLTGAAVRLAPWREGRPLVLVEGVEDGLAVALAMGGEAGVWAVLGAPNAAAVDLPGGAEITLCLDGDEAGRRAAEEAARRIGARGHLVRVAELPDGADPASMLAGAGA